MGLSITNKILKSHLIGGQMNQGEEITISVDQTLWTDLTGVMGAQILENINPTQITAQPSVFYMDHNTLVTATETSDDHLYIKTIAEHYGAYYSKPGNGVCHFLHVQRFAQPGKVMLGADSHTPTSGAVGMLAIGSGGLTVAKGMLGEGFKLAMPKVINVKLLGKLNNGVSAKDVALEALRRLSVKGCIGYIMEFTGDGVSHLSVPQRATIANMTIEMGATSGLFQSDEVTKKFLQGQGRISDWIELTADEDAYYDKSIEIDLSLLEPLVAKPHMPDLVSNVKDLKSVKVNSVFVGSCTNASFSDIAKVARILKGKKINKDVDLTVAPGSKQVLEQLINENILIDLISAGARILECACGPCVGIGQAPPSNGVSVRTSNRNFIGRSGTVNGSVYLVSPETAAVTALTGVLSDPREIIDSNILENILELDEYPVDDSLIISPKDIMEPRDVKIIRGDNISKLPERGALKPAIQAKVSLKLGNNITTDDIIPASTSILKYIANIPKFSEYTFCYIDEKFSERAKELKQSILIGGENYGQGSSREHAALNPMFLGVEAVVAKSFARIHKENLVNYGILPLVFKNYEDYDKINMDDVLVIENIYDQIESGQVIVKNTSSKVEIVTLLELSDFDRDILKVGGTLNYIRNKMI